MKKVLVSAVAAYVMTATAAFAADLPVKAVPVIAPAPSPWDIAFGAALSSDYRFRGISQSALQPSVSAYFEPRYNINPNLQIYAGLAGASISFPNRAAAEIDFYAGIRPTFGALALDFGALYYWYPGGQCFNGPAFCGVGAAFLPNGNGMKDDVSFLEVYARGIYSVTDALQLGFNVFWTDSFLNSDANGTYASGTIKYAFPTFSNGVGVYTSAEFGYQWLGTTDDFYGLTGLVGGPGLDLPSYATWNVGVGFTYKVLALDLRYIDTNLSQGECNALTGDHTTTSFGQFVVPGLNPGGLGSKWCGATFVAKLSADLTIGTNVK
jgi:uncharacterized protein (TIGR02001 family)